MDSAQRLVFTLFLAGTLIACVQSICQMKPRICEGPVKGRLNGVTYGGSCSGTERVAQLVRGTNANLTISFTPQVGSNTLKSVVHGIVYSHVVPFPLKNPNGCKNSNVTCPIKAGQEYDYVTSISVHSYYPRIRAIVKWELHGDNNEEFACFYIPVQIV